MPTITFANEKKEIQVRDGANLRRETLQAGVVLYPGIHQLANCHGLGTCGSCRVLVTDGANPAAEAHLDGFRQSLPPPAVTVRKVTGAGDMFMAAHIAAEKAGKDRPAALQAALDGAARYISAEGAA